MLYQFPQEFLSLGSRNGQSGNSADGDTIDIPHVLTFMEPLLDASCFKVFHSLAFDYLIYVTSRYCTHSNTYVDLSHHENFATRPSCVRLPHRHHVISGAADLCWRSVRPSILLTLLPLYPARYRHLGRLPPIYSASW